MPAETSSGPGSDRACRQRLAALRTASVNASALTDVPETIDSVVIRRIGEPLQSDITLLTRLGRAGFRPEAAVSVCRADGRVRIGTGGHETAQGRVAGPRTRAWPCCPAVLSGP
jgi:hypothetical protein